MKSSQTAARLSSEQVFNIAAPHFKWNAAGWQEATEGTVNMVNLPAFAQDVIDAAAQRQPLNEYQGLEWLRDALGWDEERLGDLNEGREVLVCMTEILAMLNRA